MKFKYHIFSANYVANIAILVQCDNWILVFPYIVSLIKLIQCDLVLRQRDINLLLCNKSVDYR